MKILLIGGTGTISSAITRQLAAGGHDLWLLNRGNRKNEVPENVKQIIADINDEESVLAGFDGETFDAVCEFIGFVPAQVERDIRLFTGRTRQYVYISSASAYNKPAASHVITEGTTLANPHWEYSRNKIACEDLLMKAYREQGFPVTIVRPSHTYCERGVPVSVHGPKGSWPVLKRMIEGKPVIIQGDGSSLWTLTWNQIYECVGNALHTTPRIYHVASEFLAAVSPKEWDFEGNLLGDKSVTVVFDCSKLKRAVPGFQCTTRFDEGVRRCIAYLKEHPELQVADPEFDAWCDRVIEVQEQAKAKLTSQ